MSTATLSLYRLDQELADLLAYRAERIEDRDSPASSEELEACDTAIRAYMEQLPRKVDGVASFIRHCERLIEEDDAEIARYKAHRAAVIDNRDRVKDCAAAVLEKQPMPVKGCRKLVGSHSTIYLKGNGGVAPLVVSQPDLIPDELCTCTGAMPYTYMIGLADLIDAELGEDEAKEFSGWFTRVPSNSLIREALLQPCVYCDGTGKSVESVVCASDGPCECPAQHCPACGGSGKNAVPGCRLEERGSHVEVK